MRERIACLEKYELVEQTTRFQCCGCKLRTRTGARLWSVQWEASTCRKLPSLTWTALRWTRWTYTHIALPRGSWEDPRDGRDEEKCRHGSQKRRSGPFLGTVLGNIQRSGKLLRSDDNLLCPQQRYKTGGRPAAVAAGLITSLDDFNDAVRARVDKNRSAIDDSVAIIANSIFRRNLIIGYAIIGQICAHPHVTVVRI